MLQGATNEDDGPVPQVASSSWVVTEGILQALSVCQAMYWQWYDLGKGEHTCMQYWIAGNVLHASQVQSPTLQMHPLSHLSSLAAFSLSPSLALHPLRVECQLEFWLRHLPSFFTILCNNRWSIDLFSFLNSSNERVDTGDLEVLAIASDERLKFTEPGATNEPCCGCLVALVLAWN